MGIGYRASLTLPAVSDATTLVEEQLRSWLREKRERSPLIFSTADWDGPGVHQLGPGAELVVVHDDTLTDITRRRYHLRECNSGQMWGVIVSVLDVIPVVGRSDTIVIEAELEGVSTAEALRRVSTPRVVEYILGVTDASNGRTRLNSSPEVIGPSRMVEVLEAISDETRSSAVIVAASLDAERDQNYLKAIAGLTRQSRGLATTYLINEAAVRAFNAALPPSHRIARGSIRTFMPAVQFKSIEDGRRHPLVTPVALSSAYKQGRVDDALQGRHAWTIRARALKEVLPRDVRRGLDLLGRQELEIQREEETARRTASSAPLAELSSAVAPAHRRPEDGMLMTAADERIDRPGAEHAAPEPAAWPARLASLTLTWIGRDDQTDEAIEHLHEYIKQQVNAQDVAVEQLEGAVERTASLEEQIEAMQQRLEALELDAAVEAERAREGERLVRAYQGRIRGEHPAEDLAVAPLSEEWTVPESVAELMLRLAPESSAIAARVVFTGDPEFAATLDVGDPFGRLAGHFWDYATVLFDYAELKSRGEITGPVQTYLASHSPPGRRCVQERHAERLNDALTVSVPKSVSLSAQVPASAYFRPSHTDATAPRMYYYDDVLRSGRIYIGYIGPRPDDTD